MQYYGVGLVMGLVNGLSGHVLGGPEMQEWRSGRSTSVQNFAEWQKVHGLCLSVALNLELAIIFRGFEGGFFAFCSSSISLAFLCFCFFKAVIVVQTCV